MANELGVAKINAIETLYKRGWSRRRIARDLGLDRGTVSRHVMLLKSGEPGGAATDPDAAEVPAGIRSKPAKVPAGIRSLCVPYHDFIMAGIEAGLTAQRIYQDLRYGEGYEGGYDSVKRYVRRYSGDRSAVERIECAPGDEAQVDFGKGAPVLGGLGRSISTWVFRIVLSHSRKAYSEAVIHQGSEEYIRGLENSFRAFGGVPRTLVIDNLRAAVQHADWYEPEIVPLVADFCRHYGTVILPTRPYHPEHKGKVERGIGYVKGNGLKSRRFGSLAEENAWLRWWEEHVADERLHGTTRKHVRTCFEEHERGALQTLPEEPFPYFREGRRTVHRDGYAEVCHAYYEVPEEYIGRRIWARWDSHIVRLYDSRMKQIAIHARREPGQFSGMPGGNGRYSVERTAVYWCERAREIGPACGAWAERVRVERGVESIRVLIGLQQLEKKDGREALERACAAALTYDTTRLRDVRRLIGEKVLPVQLSFLEHHPLIRDMQEYGSIVAGAGSGL